MGQVIRLPIQELPQPLSVKEINKLASMCVMLNDDFQFMLDTATGLRRVDNPHYRSLLRKYLTRLKLFYG